MKHERPGIELSGQPLSFAEMVRIGSGKVALSVSETGMARVELARSVVEEAIEAGIPVYGSTTGVGAMKDVEWSPEDLDTFNLGLVRAHHFGTGTPFSTAVVRNAMAIRINTALTGQVGCTADLIETYLRLLRADLIPVVRRTGSIGCADIGLMGQIGAVLTGVGEAVYRGRRMQAAEAFQTAGTRAGEDGAARQPCVTQHQCREFCSGSGGDAQCRSVDSRVACDRHDGRRRAWRVARPMAVGAACRHPEGGVDRRMAMQCVGSLGMAGCNPRAGPSQPPHDCAGLRRGDREPALHGPQDSRRYRPLG